MTFRIALSGLNAASSELSTTANNIANANTAGFKESRAQFADFFPTSAYGLDKNAIGGGVRVASVSQQFAQGSVSFTDNSLDLAISGEGFFSLNDNGRQVYTRNGAFGTDRNGFVINSSNQRLQVNPPLPDGSGFDTARLTDLQLSTADNPPSATTQLGATLNLPANAAVPANPVFSATDPTSYSHTTSVTVYDSLGTPHAANLYFVKSAAANTWDLHTQIDGTAVGGATSLVYSANGALTTPAGGTVTLPTHTPTTGAAALDLTLALDDTTQFGSQFAVSALTQDGYTSGRLTGLEIGADGVVLARYTNSRSMPLGQLAMARFANPQGLQQLGGSTWGETSNSGAVLRGVAGNGSFGDVQSGALEASNVDLTEQLVNMITAQRNFQANAQMISTSDQITQTIINIR